MQCSALDQFLQFLLWRGLTIDTDEKLQLSWALYSVLLELHFKRPQSIVRKKDYNSMFPVTNYSSTHLFIVGMFLAARFIIGIGM
jgi:hypothetical protein